MFVSLLNAEQNKTILHLLMSSVLSGQAQFSKVEWVNYNNKLVMSWIKNWIIIYGAEFIESPHVRVHVAAEKPRVGIYISALYAALKGSELSVHFMRWLSSLKVSCCGQLEVVMIE